MVPTAAPTYHVVDSRLLRSRFAAGPTAAALPVSTLVNATSLKNSAHEDDTFNEPMRERTWGAAAVPASDAPIGAVDGAEGDGDAVPAAAAHMVAEPLILNGDAEPASVPDADAERPANGRRPRPVDTERTSDALSAREMAEVDHVLHQYRKAYERLDARAAKAVYPSVDDRALRRAFEQLENQHLRFASCRVSITGHGANALCQGDVTVRTKAGSRVVRLTEREWTFSLSRDEGGWQILKARLQ